MKIPQSEPLWIVTTPLTRWWLALLPATLFGQIEDANAHLWLMYFGDHPIKQTKFGVHLESQARRTNLEGQWQQFMFRPGLNYQMSERWTATAGYLFADNWPYGDFPAASSFREHRIYEQLWGKYKHGPIPVQHRLRLEQRYVEKTNSPEGGWEYRNRFRYMFRGDIPFGESRWYLGLYDEVFLNFGKNRGPHTFDQNRAYGAVGFKLTGFEKIEVGYLHQFIPQRNGIIVEHNHTVQIGLYSTRIFGGSQ